jgi:ABC-type transport system involved in multi-copper enzyme maturation permease subunit
MQTLQACLTWVRRRVGWSNSRQSWQERIALVFVVAGAIALLLAPASLSPGVLLALWTLLLLVSAIMLRRGWLKMFGPVLFYDLIRTSRRTRHAVLRSLYVILLAVVIGWLYALWWERSDYRGEPQRNDIVELNVQLFHTFMFVQFTMVVLITPAYVAGAIADEKDRRTLEFLLATDLRSREIVFGKTLARVLSILMIVLAGLPVLSILQILGGVGPDLVMAAFAATIFTIAGLAGVGIACSTLARRSRDAILLTYLAMFAYGVVSIVAYAFAHEPGVARVLSNGVHWQLPWPKRWHIDVTLNDILQFLVAGNPVVSSIELFSAGNVSATISRVLPRYLIFHGVLAVLLTSLASWRLRSIAANEVARVRPKESVEAGSVFRARPEVWPAAMLWKELFIGSNLRLSRVTRLFFALVLGALIVTSFLVLFFALDLFRGFGSFEPEIVNVWVRTAGTMVGVLMWILIAVRAAGSISGEREKLTFSELLVTPLSADDIWYSKLLGAVFSVRWLGILWLGGMWGVGLLLGGLSLWAIPLLVGTWFIYAAFGAVVGLWFSAHCKSSLRATIWTILTLGLLSVGHWLFAACVCYMPMAFVRYGGEVEHIMLFEAGQTPPIVLGALAMYDRDFRHGVDRDFVEFGTYCVLGIGVWAFAAVVIGGLGLNRFRWMTNRMTPLRPDHDACLPLQRRGRKKPRRVTSQSPMHSSDSQGLHPQSGTLE